MAMTFNQIRKTYGLSNEQKKKMQNEQPKTFAEIRASANDYGFKGLKSQLESTIRFDSFNEDLSSLGKSITDVYNGWQSPETMKNTLSSIEGMQGRLKAYDEYRRLFGGKDAPNLSDLSKGYTKAVDNLGTLAEEYGRYQNADSYRRETDTLKKLASMTSKDIEPYLTQKQEGKPTFEGPEYEPEDVVSDNFGSIGKTIDHYDEDGNPVYVKDAQKHRSSAGRLMTYNVDSPIAYTTVGGQNITWQQLYDKKKKQEEHDALWKKVSTDADFEKYKNLGETSEKTNPVKWSVENKDGHYSEFADMAYTVLNDEELGIYNYYLGQEYSGAAEKGTAQKYLDSIYKTLKGRYEGDVIESMTSFADEHPILGSVASVGMNLLAPIEWLGDSVTYAFTGDLDDNALARTATGMRGAVADKYDWKVGGWDLFDFTYNTAMSGVESLAASYIPGGAFLLGGSAAAQATNDALDRGLSPGQAFATGLASGVFEGLFESFSIGKLKSLKDASISGLKTYIKDIGKSMLVNATEETATELANVAYDYFVNADLSQMATSYRAYVNGGMSEEDAKNKVIWETAQRVGEAGLSGALMGLGFGAGGGAIAGYKNNATGKAISGNNRTGEMLNLASMSPSESDVYKAYTEYANKGINADNITNTQLGALHNQATADAMKVMNSKKSTAEQKASAENTLRDLTAFTQESKVDAKAFTDEDVAILVEQALENGEDTLSHQLATKYKAKLDSGKKLTSKEITRLVEANDAIFRPEAKSDVEAQLTELGETGDVAKIANAIIKKQSGEILTTAELNAIKESKYGGYVEKGMTSEEIVSTEEALGNSAKVMSKDEAKLFKELYDGSVDVEDFRDSFNLAITYAEKDYSQDVILKNKGVLTEAQVSAIYSATVMAKRKAQADKIAKAHEKMGAKMSYKGFIDDSVINYSDKYIKGKVRWKHLKPKQRQAITFVKGIAKATGMNLVLTNKGLKEGYNGFYVDSNNTITLDIDAGIDVAKGKLEDTIIPTVSHELTHWMKNKAPELYRKMDELIFKTLGNEEQRVATELAKLKERLGNDVTEEQARDEIIARACEDMLKMSEEGKKLFESLSEVEQKSLMRKIKDFLYDLKAWITDLLSSYKSNSPEAQMLREYEEALNEISKMWDAMFAEAIKNNQALELSGEYGHGYGKAAVETNSETSKVDTNGEKYVDIIFARGKLTKAEGVTGKKLFQFRAMETDKDIYREMLLKHKDTIGITDKQITDLFNMIDKAVDIISDNLEALDYAWDADINDRAFMPVKPNSDSLYKVSLDFSTLCRKRLLQQSIQALLQKTLDKQLSREESIAIRDELLKIQEEGRQIEVACALCYVESARMKSPKQITKFLNSRESVIREFFASRSGGSIKEKIKNAEMKAREKLKKENPDGLKGKNGVILDALTAPLSYMLKADADYVRSEKKKAKTSYKLTAQEQAELDAALKMAIENFTSAKGLENLAKHHREIFDAYTSFIRNATHFKGIENDTWWRAGDSDLIGDNLIAQMNAENGLRSQSWSDFQVIHLLDYIAATIELSTKGAKRQSYTKVPDYVKLLGNTGDMINMSVIPERAFSGKLGYDDVEGMAYKIAVELREQYHETAGIICIGMKDAQIRMLLADATIDMVIPYHKSSMSQATKKLMHIPEWDDYEDYQIEKNLSDTEAQERAKKYGFELDKDSKVYGKAPKFSEWFNFEEARQIAKMENNNPSDAQAQKKYGTMYGAYKAMQYAADKYLKLCAERGLAPKFSHQNADFTTEANYWKLLIDRKMVDNVTGEVIEQTAIKPIFNEAHILEILNDELARYPQVKADQEYATRKVTEKFLSGEMKVDDSTLEAIQKPVDNVTNVNILESKKQFALRDSDYMDAVNKGDMKTAQKMVDERAKKAGYHINAYHGTPNNDFTVFDKDRVGKGIDQYGAGFYFASNKDAARGYGARVINSRLALNNPFKIDGSSAEGANLIDAGFNHLLTEEQAYEVIKRLPNIYDEEESPLGDYYESYWETGAEDWMIEDLASNESNRNIGYLDSDLFRNYPNELHEALRDVVGYDGIEVTFDNGDKFYVAWFDNQMKSAEPVTYDDDGNVIPLSKRFNTENKDIRYSLRDNSDTELEEADEKTEKDRDYSYAELTKKPDMVISKLSAVSSEEVSKYDADHTLFAKDMRDIARSKGNDKNSKNATYLYCKDLDEDVLIAIDSFKHGSQSIDATYVAVCKNIAELLNSSVVVNELAPRDKINGSYVLLGLAENEDNYVIVRSIINKRTWKLVEFNELGAIKKTSIKKEDVGVKPPISPPKRDFGTSSTISISDFLEIVNKESLSNIVLSMDVINQLNSTRIYDKKLTPSLQFSLRDSEGNTLTEAQAEFFKDSKARDAEGNLIVCYHGTDTKFTIFDADFISKDNKLGYGFYFMAGKELQYSYENPIKAYLNITNPITDTSKNLSKEKLIKFCKKLGIVFDYDVGDYDLDVYARLCYEYTGETKTFLKEAIDLLGVDGILSNERNVAVAFDSNQIKLTTNVNPTSNPDIQFALRDTESAHDILGETERLRKENEMLRKDFEALQERLKLERQVTHGNYFNEKQLGVVAGYLRNQVKSNYAKDELIARLKDAYSYIAQKGEYADLEAITFDEFYEKAYGIAVNILNEAKPEVEVNDYAKHLLGEIRRTRISLSATQKAEAEYRFGENYHRMFFGKVIIANDGIPLDSQWVEWSHQYPGYFNAETNEGDQIVELYDAIESLKDASEVLVEYNTAEQARWLATEIYNKYWTVSPIETTADKYDKKIRLLNLEHRNRISELRDAYNERLKEQHKSDRAKFLEQAKKIREHRDMKIAEAKELGRERLSQYRENAERKTRIQRITQNALTLNEWLVKNSKEKHIHESLKGPVVALLNALDFSSKRLLDKGEPTKKDISLSEALSDVREMMLNADEIGAENGNTLGTALAGYDFTEDMKAIVDSVRKISKEFGDNEFVLNNMALEDLQKLDKIVRVIKHSVSKMNKLHAAKFYAGVVELSEQSEKELNARAKVVKDHKKHFDQLKMKSLWNNTTPYYAFKRFGPAAQAIFRAMQDGQDKLAFLAKEVIDFTEKTYTKKELKEWSKKYYEFEIAQPDGTTAKFSLNLPQMMSLYCLVKQEDARRHILYGNEEGNGGGITIVETKETDAVRTNILLTEVDLNSILTKLNENKRAKEVADKLQEYMGARGAELGNEITMARWGINSFGIKDYFPIKVSSDTIGNKDDTIGVEGNSLVKLLNMSFTKARNKFASNSVEIGDIFDVFSSHMSDMIRYNSFALPILDMYKWMNYRGKDGFGKEHSVSKSIKDTFGEDAWNYVRKFMEDTNGSSKSQRRDNLAIKFFKNAKVAKVASSISTILLQPTSYIRAGAVMDNKYLIRALGHKPKVNHAKKYCGIALWKSLGYYDTDITRGLTEKIKHDASVKDNITEASLYGVAKADEITWGYLWNACELEVRDKQPKLKPGTKEFFDAVGLRLRDIVYATQVVDSTMTRSNLMRGTDGMDKFITTFASEPTLALNMVNDAFISAKLSKRMGEKVDKKHIRKTITAYTVTNIVAAAVQTLMSAFRDIDDDKEEDYYWWLMLQNIGLNTSYLNKLPWINQMFSVLQGFDSKRMDTEWMDKAVKSASEVLKLMDGKGSVEKMIRYGLGSLSDATGIAGYNLYRDVMATIDLFTDVSGKED